MDFSSVTSIAFSCASALSLLFSITCLYQFFKNRLHLSFIFAGILQTFYFALIANIPVKLNLSLEIFIYLEAIYSLGWIAALIFCKRAWGIKYKSYVYTALILALSFASFASAGTLYFLDFTRETVFQIFVWQGIFLSLAGLICVEQLYRNVDSIRIVKIICINLFVLFLFNIYLFTQNMLDGYLSETLWQTRASITIVTSVIMSVASLTLTSRVHQPTAIRPSRPLVFYSSSLTIAGFLFVFFAIGGYYVQRFDSSWGSVIYTTALIFGSTAILVVFSSMQMRKKINVLINKHLFSHKYDYREEWLKIINQLSQPTSQGETYTRALNIMSEIFKCGGGAIWLKRGHIFTPIQQHNIEIDNFNQTFEPSHCEYLKIFEQHEWVYCFHGDQKSLQKHNEYLPIWIRKIDNIAFIVPLICDNALIGYAVFTDQNNDIYLNWEDLDLIKTVGRQVASYIERNEQAEQLSESRQFETFNKLSAFVMHDLKNLIAQQSLLVTNADKHKDNPVFIDDVINTVNNSVSRMNNLLRKLQHNEPEQAKTVRVKEILIESIKRCQKTLPVPSLLQIDNDWKITADPDSLSMTFTHIIQNAQDATPNDGYVEISATVSGAFLEIRVEDNGKGMSQDFIQNGLFRPFETTKTGKGMGIGVFQAREYIQSLEGKIIVDSVLHEGTTMIISLPIDSTTIASYEPITKNSESGNE